MEPLFLLEAHERPLAWDEALASFDRLVAEHHHVDLYWFPHTDLVHVKTNDRLDAPLTEAEPLGRLRGWVDDDFLSNTVFGALLAGANRVPRVIPSMNRVASAADVAPALLRRRPPGVHHAAAGGLPGDGVRRAARGRPGRAARGAPGDRGVAWRISFPVEVRVAPADDIPLSTAYGRDSVYLAFHTHARRRPHGVLHGDRAGDAGPRRPPALGQAALAVTRRDLAPAYPRFDDFLALRDRLDPDRVFANAYLRRVLG